MSSSKQGLMSRIFGKRTPKEVSNSITQGGSIQFGAMPSSISSMIASTGKQIKTRDTIYQKWSNMEHNPIISTAIQLLSTAALGGHETTGQIVFIEPTAEASKDKKLKAIVDEISKEITPLFNKVAFQLSCTAAIYGDAYVRINTREKEGVVDLYVGEMIHPMLVQPFERCGTTQGYVVYSGKQFFEKFDALQIGRVKLPRLTYLPQTGDIEKSFYSSLTEDNPDNWELMPSSAGGSFLIPAETAFDNLNSALLGIVGQRLLDSIDEQILLADMSSMTSDQQKKYLKNITAMLTRSQEIANTAVQENKPVLERIRHIIPVFGEKQLLTVAGSTSAARASSIQVDDVMLHAKMLAGSLGVDLSMLGFADQLSGGFGDGGYFRVSAQVAERGRILRTALSELFDHVISVHLIKKGIDFGDDKPWAINFYGNISALESERMRTRLDAMASGMQLAQSMQQMKEMGVNKEIMQAFLSKTMLVDEDLASIYAKIVDIKTPDQAAQEDQEEPPQQEQESNDDISNNTDENA